MTDQQQNDLPGENDSRLNSFLRKAGAIIASERGLNTRSRMLLQSLADRTQLPDELFEKALLELQNPESTDSARLGRWERAFIQFLDKEFKNLPRGILTTSMENRAINLAKRKYQISDARAGQLIQQRAEAMGIGRIPVAEAQKYVRQGIVDRLEDKTAIESDLRDQLYSTGHRWGLPRDQVDAIILETLAGNRKKNRPRLLKPLILLLVVTLFGGGGWLGYHYGWFGQLMVPAVTDNNPNLTKPIINLNENKSNNSIWSTDINDRLNELAKNNTQLKSILQTIDTRIPTQQTVGLKNLVRRICNPTTSVSSDFQKAFGIVYYFGHKESSAAAVAEIQNYFGDRTSLIPQTLPQLNAAYRANELIASTWFFDAKLAGESDHRRQEIRSTIQSFLGIDINDMQIDEYLKLSEKNLAIDQWSNLLQTSWSSPARTSKLIKPLYELTRSKLDRATLNQLQHRVTLATLEASPSQWSQMRDSIENAIETGDDIKLNQWLLALENSNDNQLKAFLGQALLRKTEIKLTSFSQSEIADALKQYRLNYRNKIFQPLIERNQLAVDRARQAGKLANSEFAKGQPDSIATLVAASNANLSLYQSIKLAQDDFTEFDNLIAQQVSKLSDLIALPADSQAENSDRATTPTASDNREKTSAIRKLTELRLDQVAARMSALDRLARIANRYRDISSDEASVLAGYFLEDLKEQQWLNVEKNLADFRHWHKLALALSDQIPESNASLDQCITIASILYEREFRVTNKLDLQKEVFDLASKRIHQVLSQAPNQTQLDWNRLRVYLAAAYRRRAELFGIEPARANLNRNVVGEVEDTILHIANAQLEPEVTRRFINAIQLIRDENQTELKSLVALSQILVDVRCLQLQQMWPNERASIGQVFQEFRQRAGNNSTLGARLFSIELTMLQFSNSERELELKRRLERN